MRSDKVDIRRATEAARIAAALDAAFNAARMNATQDGAAQMALALFVAPLVRGNREAFSQWMDEADRAWDVSKKRREQ